MERFNAAMRDDFNTAEAIAVLFEVNKELNRAVKEQQADQAAVYYSTLRHLTNILGLVQHDVDEFLKSDIGQDALGLSEQAHCRLNSATSRCRKKPKILPVLMKFVSLCSIKVWSWKIPVKVQYGVVLIN